MALSGECRLRFALWGAMLFVLVAGCDVSPTRRERAAGPPAPPPAPEAGLLLASDDQSPEEPAFAETTTASSNAAGFFIESPDLPTPAVSELLPALTSEESEIQAMFADVMAAAQSTDGKQILARCTPVERSRTILRMASTGYLLLGPQSEVGRMIQEAGLFAEEYHQMFNDLRDGKIDSPQEQALVEEAAAKLRDPERLVTLVRRAIQPSLPEARYELVSLSIDGDRAAGVTLMVTYLGTSAGPFAAQKIDGKWTPTAATPEAEAKVKEYELNPFPATVTLPPRKQVHVTAGQLSQKFQENPAEAARTYGGPYAVPPGPRGILPGPFGGAGGPAIPQPPQIRDHEIILEGTIALLDSSRHGPVVYLVTPTGLPAVNLSASGDSKLGLLLEGAKTGQTLVAVVDSALLLPTVPGTPGTVAVSSRQIEIRGEPAEPHGPLTTSEFSAELDNPADASKNQARPIILQGKAVFAEPSALLVALADEKGTRIVCALRESERERFQSLRQGANVVVQGSYIAPSGGNQVMLRGCVFVGE